MSQNLAMPEGITNLEGDIDRVWDLLVEGRKIRAKITADSKVLNPFSSLFITFELDGEVLTRVETLLKCDVLGPCRYCFMRDYSSLVLTKDRVEKVVETWWENVLCWSGSPIFEDSYFESIEVKQGLMVGRVKERLLLYRYNALEIERQDSLFRVSVIEPDKLVRYFTEYLEVHV